jgi:hypothetical protein
MLHGEAVCSAHTEIEASTKPRLHASGSDWPHLPRWSKMIQDAQWQTEIPSPSACFQGVLRPCAWIVRFAPHVCNERILCTCKDFQVHPDLKGSGSLEVTCVSLVLSLSNLNQGNEGFWWYPSLSSLNRSQIMPTRNPFGLLRVRKAHAILRHHDLTAAKPTPVPSAPQSLKVSPLFLPSCLAQATWDYFVGFHL